MPRIIKNTIDNHIKDYIFLNKEKNYISNNCLYIEEIQLNNISKMFNVNIEYLLKLFKVDYYLTYQINELLSSLNLFDKKGLLIAKGTKLFYWSLSYQSKIIIDDYHKQIVKRFVHANE